GAPRAGRRRDRRTERLRQVQRRRRDPLGSRLAQPERAARREAGRRALRGCSEPRSRRFLRGRAALRQRGRQRPCRVFRALDLEAEVRKRLRPLALQATAAERAEKLRGEIATLRARIAELDLASLDERLTEAGERKTAAVFARRAAEERLEAVLAERGGAEEELADAAGTREQAMQVLYRLRSVVERLGLPRESATTLLEHVRSALADAETDA